MWNSTFTKFHVLSDKWPIMYLHLINWSNFPFLSGSRAWHEVWRRQAGNKRVPIAVSRFLIVIKVHPFISIFKNFPKSKDCIVIFSRKIFLGFSVDGNFVFSYSFKVSYAIRPRELAQTFAFRLQIWLFLPNRCLKKVILMLFHKSIFVMLNLHLVIFGGAFQGFDD